MVDSVEYEIIGLLQQRQKEYGNSLEVAAELITTWMGDRIDGVFDSSDIAMMMVLVKAARMSAGQFKPDNFFDMAGYAVLAAAEAAKQKPDK